MRMFIFGLPILVISAGLIIAGYTQQPDDRKGGPPPQWNPVHVFPPDVRDSLNLSAEQEKQIDDLEKEVRGKIEKILTAQQRRTLSQARPRGPGGPGGPDGIGGPPDGPGRRPGRDDQRPGGPGEPPPPPRGGPEDSDAPPPPPPGPPSGPREWEEAAESLKLSGALRDKTDDVIDQMREKLDKQHAEAHADLVRQLKTVLSPEQFQTFEKSLEDAAPRPPR